MREAYRYGKSNLEVFGVEAQRAKMEKTSKFGADESGAHLLFSEQL